MRRDTLLVRPNGHIVLRFKSDNPGVWLFHCHIEWHVDSGLIMTFVEVSFLPPLLFTFHLSVAAITIRPVITTTNAPQQPLALQKTLPSRIPADHFAACAAMDPPMPTLGNAAGNTENFYDLAGANVSPAPLPDGFGTKGIVAMAFSILAGLLGVGTVIWYGLGEMGTIEAEREKKRLDKIAGERGVGSRSNKDVGAGGDQITRA